MEELEKRLRARGTDDDEKVKQRLETAAEEIKHAEIEGFHDKILINDDLTGTFEELEKYIFQTDAAETEETPAAEEAEGATEAVSAVAEGDDTTMAEGDVAKDEGATEAVSAVAEGDDTTMVEGDAAAVEKE
jgi:guanylate kinase